MNDAKKVPMPLANFASGFLKKVMGAPSMFLSTLTIGPATIRDAHPGAVCGDGARLAAMIELTYQDEAMALRDDATHARSLIAAGFGDDVDCCLAVDSVPVAVRYRERMLHAVAVTSG